MQQAQSANLSSVFCLISMLQLAAPAARKLQNLDPDHAEQHTGRFSMLSKSAQYTSPGSTIRVNLVKRHMAEVRTFDIVESIKVWEGTYGEKHTWGACNVSLSIWCKVSAEHKLRLCYRGEHH